MVEIKLYVKEMLKQGFSEEAIRKKLIESNYLPHYIDKIFSDIRKQDKNELLHKKIVKISILLLFLLLIFISGNLVINTSISKYYINRYSDMITLRDNQINTTNSEKIISTLNTKFVNECTLFEVNEKSIHTDECTPNFIYTYIFVLENENIKLDINDKNRIIYLAKEWLNYFEINPFLTWIDYSMYSVLILRKLEAFSQEEMNNKTVFFINELSENHTGVYFWRKANLLYYLKEGYGIEYISDLKNITIFDYDNLYGFLCLINETNVFLEKDPWFYQYPKISESFCEFPIT